jgi:hypothetical protein
MHQDPHHVHAWILLFQFVHARLQQKVFFNCVTYTEVTQKTLFPTYCAHYTVSKYYYTSDENYTYAYMQNET